MSDFENIHWLTDEKYRQMPPWERALHWASLYAVRGVKEQGKNAGPWVVLFLSKVGLGPGYAWCAAFVYHCLLKGEAKSLPSKWKAAGVRYWVEWAKKEGRLVQTPQRGDLFYWLNANGSGHIGFVRNTGAWPQYVETIEGNTDKGGSREGDGVYYRSRTRRELELHFESGFIRLKD